MLKTYNLAQKMPENMPFTVEDGEDFGPSETAFWIADVMGELDIGGDGAVFILPGDCPDIHAYLNNAFYHNSQYHIENTHAYMFFGPENNLC